MVRTNRLTFQAPGQSCVYVQIDGEYAGRLPAEVRMVPDALTLLIPPAYSRVTSEGALAVPGRV